MCCISWQHMRKALEKKLSVLKTKFYEESSKESGLQSLHSTVAMCKTARSHRCKRLIQKVDLQPSARSYTNTSVRLVSKWHQGKKQAKIRTVVFWGKYASFGEGTVRKIQDWQTGDHGEGGIKCPPECKAWLHKITATPHVDSTVSLIRESSLASQQHRT